MSKIEIEAIRNLPEEYVADGTCTCRFGELVVAMHLNLPPIVYDGGWRELEKQNEVVA